MIALLIVIAVVGAIAVAQLARIAARAHADSRKADRAARDRVEASAREERRRNEQLLERLAVIVEQLEKHELDGPSLVGRIVEVHTERPDDQTLRGRLVAQHADRWTFEEVLYRHPSGDQPHGDPVVHVPTRKIAWYSEPKTDA